jgi:tRNA threonylcarbamoyladenosine modification (KEOPS) complex  Pcc1 subunit
VRAKKTGGHVAVFTASAPKGAKGAARLKALEQALAPEAAGALPGARIRVRRLRAGGPVEIRIEAESVRTLRAAVNSYLRAAGLALDVADASLAR